MVLEEDIEDDEEVAAAISLSRSFEVPALRLVQEIGTMP
jgi:hypothetical protein